MKNSNRTLLLFLVSTLLSGVVWRASAQNHEGPEPKQSQPANAQDGAAAAAAFESIVPVLRHPRCMNCHSSGDFPRQGDDNHRHTMRIRRGPEGEGVNAVRCSGCHQDHNLAGLHMPPGAPDWRLPSPSMPTVWEGLSDHQLCELFKDSNQNGHRSIAQIVEHMQTPLVLWGWNPGEGRTPIPMSQQKFLAEIKTWAEKGAACPPAQGMTSRIGPR